MTLLHVLAAALFATLAPETSDDEAKSKSQCLASCDGNASATDRESCRLQCDEAARSRTAPNVVRWKRTEHLGGAPPGSKNKGGKTTTTTVETPSGTTTTTESTGGPTGSTPGATDPTGTQSYAALARCQMTCDVEKKSKDDERASCKLVCLKTFPSIRRKTVFVPKKRAEANQRDRPASSSR